ncbi:hypothetical protein [Flavobacterium sp. TBRC 19031]|uniref:hypothetical protein n=1 Tax=Flavobacterium mekongense TaxID=3379707 RepID=UPI00399B9816
MNEAHLHMVVNHFPIIGTILGAGIILAGIFLKNNTIKNVAYVLFVVAAVFAAASMATGEGAEEMVEDMPTVGHDIIHEHEEIAEKLALALYVLGAVSLFGLYANIKKHSQSKMAAIVTLVISIVAIYFAQLTGTTGGEIRHTEIRTNGTGSEAAPNTASETESEHEE